jgi:hypothetical protein
VIRLELEKAVKAFTGEFWIEILFLIAQISLLYGEQAKYFDDEIHKKYKFSRRGLVAMANRGAPNTNQSQFFITTGDNLSYLNEKHTIFGEVAEGYEVVERINDAYVDEKGQPHQNIRLRHTVVLEDPFEDPKGFSAPERSPRSEQMLRVSECLCNHIDAVHPPLQSMID